jgi:hypothetical protein
MTPQLGIQLLEDVDLFKYTCYDDNITHMYIYKLSCSSFGNPQRGEKGGTWEDGSPWFDFICKYVSFPS